MVERELFLYQSLNRRVIFGVFVREYEHHYEEAYTLLVWVKASERGVAVLVATVRLVSALKPNYNVRLIMVPFESMKEIFHGSNSY